MGSYLLAPVLLLVVLLLQDHCDATAGGPDSSDASSIPLLASGKRQHNIMRFGKRPAGGHSLIHFGKREEGGSGPPKHSFLYFGKREVPDLLDYLQKSRDGSYKRGHTIMRFGKRAPDSHNFIRFGREPQDDDVPEDKRAAPNSGHAMMYFGKRGTAGHAMMYFGKRGDDDKRAHAMIHFGKRGDDDDDWEEESKRGGAHSMIHFGKRMPEEEEDDWGPERVEEEESKRGGAHSMIHFGKRVAEEDWSPEVKRQHNLLRFGKKMDRKGSHAMIHFGKRETGEDKRAHAMIHFGKRSEDEANQLDKAPLNRMKREAEHQPPAPLITLVRYDGEEGGPNQDETPKEGPAYFRPDEMWSPLYHQDQEWEPDYVEYSQPDKKDPSKNVFLRFG